jgi:hypothetical protein
MSFLKNIVKWVVDRSLEVVIYFLLSFVRKGFSVSVFYLSSRFPSPCRPLLQWLRATKFLQPTDPEGLEVLVVAAELLPRRFPTLLEY